VGLGPTPPTEPLPVVGWSAGTPYSNHPEKHREEVLVTPHRQREYRRERGDGNSFDVPEAVVVCFSRGLMEYAMEEYEGDPVGHYYGDLYWFDGTDGRVVVLGNFGIGAPTTAMLMDELVAGGTRTFLSVGIAGCLDRDVGMGEFVVCDRAIRDEGTSHHYLEPGRSVRPDEGLTAALRTTSTSARRRTTSARRGPSTPSTARPSRRLNGTRARAS